MTSIILKQLEALSVNFSSVSEIRNKDGVHVYRVFCDDSTKIMKIFSEHEHRREIKNYKILADLNIPTIKIFDATDCALLMEDIANSPIFRLGKMEDMNDNTVITAIAAWYKEFHFKGKEYLKNLTYSTAKVANLVANLYDETSVITKSNIDFIRAKTNTESNKTWAIIIENLNEIKNHIASLDKTLNYNDFYYTNMVVAKDKSSAFMFDYNLMGQGYSYADVRNVCSSLTEEAKKAFLCEYGKINQKEKTVDDVVSILTTLFFACKKETFPFWAKESLENLNSGKLLQATEKLITLK